MSLRTARLSSPKSALRWTLAAISGGVALWVAAQLMGQEAGRPQYAGSAACVGCHKSTEPELVEAWAQSRHAQARPTPGAVGMNLYRRVTGLRPDGRFREAGVSCEACHGPGSLHAQAPTRENIVRPQELGYKRASMVCAQCHARGASADGDDFPKGFLPGDDLLALFALADPPASADTAEFNEFVYDRHYARGLSCLPCHDPHGVGRRKAMLKGEGNDVCARCHPGQARDVVAHNAKARPDSACIECHMPGGSHRFVSR